MDYVSQCRLRILDAWQGKANGSSPASPFPELVGQDGDRLSGLTPNDAWGITIRECYRACDPIYNTFSFPTFSGAATSWLFLWLALIAQLPYATSSPFGNALSPLLCVGSPALATFSLVITILTKMHISHAFQKLDKEAHDPRVSKEYPRLSEKLDCMRVILQESLQAPMRIGNIQELNSVIVLDTNIEWLVTVKKNLQNTQRKTPYSLIAQILFALLAWAFTVVASFDDLGNTTVALALSASSVWLWMIPVTIGFVAVGTQSDSGNVHAAIHQTGIDILTAHDTSNTPRSKRQNALPCCTGNLEHDDESTIRPQKPPTCASAPLTGHEGQEGPIYNFARHFTSSHVADATINSFAAMIDKIKRGETPQGAGWNEVLPYENLHGTALQTAYYCNNPSSPTLPHSYTYWGDMPSRVWRQLVIASLAAVFVQWGTTGPSIMISILTPANGLGCRSGSFLIYGCVATTACTLTVLASLLSHHNILRDHAWGGRRSSRFGFAQVTCQYLGGLLAVCNAFWVVISCVMELCGGFDNCWCQGVVLSQKEHAWVLLFKGARDLRGAAQSVWVGGIVFEVFVCVLSCGFVWLGCK